jgi:hypothetical protein
MWLRPLGIGLVVLGMLLIGPISTIWSALRTASADDVSESQHGPRSTAMHSAFSVRHH